MADFSALLWEVLISKFPLVVQERTNFSVYNGPQQMRITENNGKITFRVQHSGARILRYIGIILKTACEVIKYKYRS